MSKDKYDRAGKELTFKRIIEEQTLVFVGSAVIGFWYPIAWLVTLASFIYVAKKGSELRD